MSDTARGFYFWSLGNASEAEGQREIVVRREGRLLPSASVDYTVTPNSRYSPTATPGQDFIPVSGTLVFAAGEVQQSFLIPILDDGALEGNEWIAAALSNAVGTASDWPGFADLAIADNERGFRFAGFSHHSEASSEHEIFVRREGTLLPAATVEYQVTSSHGDRKATPGQDFTPVSGTLVFAAGEVEQSFRIPLLDDGVVEGIEWLAATLSNPTGTPIEEPGFTDFPIYDNERGFHIADAGDESEAAGERRVVIRREGTLLPAASIDYQVSASSIDSPSATPGQDFTPVSGTLAFAEGEREQTLRIPILNDGLPELYEHYLVTLLNAIGTPFEEPRSRLELRLRIADNERGYFLQGFLDSADGPLAIRERTGEVLIAVSREGDYAFPSTLGYRIEALDPDDPNPAAVPGVDFEPASGTLAFAPGQSLATMALRLHADHLAEDDKLFNLKLFDPSSGLPLSTSSELFTILDRQPSPARVDLDFHPAIRAARLDGPNPSVAVLPDGRCFVLSEAGHGRYRLLRLSGDGTTDPGFAPVELGLHRHFRMEPAPDGGVLVAGHSWDLGLGEFYLGGEPVRNLARLRPDGSRDPGFILPEEIRLEIVTALAVTANGHIALAGSAEAVRVYWLDAQGQLAQPHPVEFDGDVSQLLPLPDGSVLAHGNFGKMDGLQRRVVARIEPDGRPDHGYAALPPELEPLWPFYKFLDLSEKGPLLLARTRDKLGREMHVLQRLLPQGGLDPQFTPYRTAWPFRIRSFAAGGGRIYLDRLSERGPERLVSIGLDGQRDPGHPPQDIAFRYFHREGMALALPQLTWLNSRNALAVTGAELANGHLRPRLSALLPHAPVPRIEAAFECVRVSEGVGRALIKLLRVGDTSTPSTVRWTTANRTAQAGVDYHAASGEIAFPVGESASSISVALIDNANPDGERAFRLHFTTGPEGAALPEIEITIVNDDLGFLPDALSRRPPGIVFLRPTGHLIGARSDETSVVIEAATDFEGSESDFRLNPFETEFAWNEGEFPCRFFRLRRDP